MGNFSAKRSNKEPSPPKVDQPRRKSIRRSLRLSASGPKDVLSQTEKFLQSLNDDFDRGKVYHMKLEELKNIETELNKILTDLRNFVELGHNNAKRFELENTAKYLMNKIKSAMDNHMDNAIQRLNKNLTQTEESHDEEHNGPQSLSSPANEELRLETNKEKIAAKLRELIVKTKEVYNLLSSMNEIDEITKHSALMAIDKCKRELYNIQTSNKKLINKKWKCFRKIDEIRAILEQKITIRLPEITDKNQTETVEDVVVHSRPRVDKCEENSTDENDGEEADIEDNTVKSPDERDTEFSGNTGNPEKSEHKDKSRNDQANYKKMKEIKAKMIKIHSYVISLETVDETTKKSIDDTLRSYKKELRSLKVHSANLVKKRIRCLKKIEEICSILHDKFCEVSDGECNCCSSAIGSDPERVDFDQSAENTNKGSSETRRENQAIEGDDIHYVQDTTLENVTKRLSDNFEVTRKRINEIFGRRSASFEDFEALSRGIDDINKEFDNILKKVCHIQEPQFDDKANGSTEDMNSGENYRPTEVKDAREDTEDEDTIVTYNLQGEGKPKNIEETNISRDAPPVITVNNSPVSALLHIQNDESFAMRKTNEYPSHSQEEFRNLKPESNDMLSPALAPKARDDETVEVRAKNGVSGSPKSPPVRSEVTSDTKKYKHVHSVDDLDKLDDEPVRSKTLSEQNLAVKEDPSMTNLISARNIDLSQLTTKDSRVYSMSQLEDGEGENSVSTRNLDISQIVCRDSEMSFSEAFASANDDGNSRNETIERSDSGLYLTQSSKENEENNSSDEGGITILNPKRVDQNEFAVLEVANGEEKGEQQSSESMELANSEDVPEDIKEGIFEAQKRLDAIREQIMDFVGLKNDDLYNELDEELVAIMIIADNLNIGKDERLYSSKQRIIGELYKYSNLLERKTLDHQYLDSFEKEILFVEKEIQQSLANKKLENLENIMKDIEDMLVEIEDKILDHLLLGRRESYIQRLNCLRDKLAVFVK